MRKHIFAVPTTVLILCLASACVQPDGRLVEAEREALSKTNERMIESFRNIESTSALQAFTEYYAPDARVYAPGLQPYEGREAIDRLIDLDPFSPKDTAFEITTDRPPTISASGDFGYTAGSWTLSRDSGPTETGNYLTIWNKQDDGSWRIVEDIVNSHQPRIATDEQREALKSTNQRMIDSFSDVSSGRDLEEFLKFYAPEATIYAPAMPTVYGLTSIRSLIRKDPFSPEGTRFQMTTDEMEIAALGDIGYTAGRWTLLSDDGQTEGSYVTVWKHHGDGQWLIVQDIVNIQ